MVEFVKDLRIQTASKPALRVNSQQTSFKLGLEHLPTSSASNACEGYLGFSIITNYRVSVLVPIHLRMIGAECEKLVYSRIIKADIDSVICDFGQHRRLLLRMLGLCTTSPSFSFL